MVTRWHLRLRGNQDGALDGRRLHAHAHVPLLLLGSEEPHAAEQIQLVETQTRRKSVAQPARIAGVHPASRGDDTEAASGRKLLRGHRKEVVEVVTLSVVIAAPAGQCTQTIEEDLVTRFGHVGRIADNKVEDAVPPNLRKPRLLRRVKRHDPVTLVGRKQRGVLALCRIELTKAVVRATTGT